jgi:Zn-finger nucleic acid-binding protein
MVSCPSCGSKSSKDGHKCDHCGGRVDGKLCHTCFYYNPFNASFCMACGTKQSHIENEINQSDLLCPNCNHPKIKTSKENVYLEIVKIEIEDHGRAFQISIHNCPHCLGYWIKPRILMAMMTSAQQFRHNHIEIERHRGLEERSYLWCPHPDCHEMLSRIRWDHYTKGRDYKSSLPIIDSCMADHGIWLDTGELQWLLESKHTPSKKETTRPPLSIAESSGIGSNMEGSSWELNNGNVANLIGEIASTVIDSGIDIPN